jgi:hypothetical protein
MCLHRPTLLSAVLVLAMLLAQTSSAQQADRLKASAPEKMMPTDKTLKMRECEKRAGAGEQKIKMEDRSRFVDECVWAKAR